VDAFASASLILSIRDDDYGNGGTAAVPAFIPVYPSVRTARLKR
jgi:hypothetical protein